MIKSAIPKIIGFFASCALWLGLAQVAFAQTNALPTDTKGGTSSSLPSAGSTEMTYIFFLLGAVLFVIGAVKLVLSFRD